jgi:hypothetical protein
MWMTPFTVRSKKGFHLSTDYNYLGKMEVNMMKKIFAVLVLILLLTSCNLPIGQPTQDPAALVATRVAQTLAAAPVSTDSPTMSVLPTTALPTAELPTVSPTETATTTPTSTTSPADPKLTLGSATYFNTFSNSSGFDLASPYVDDAVNLSIHDGVMDFSSLAEDRGKRWRLTYPTPTDFYLEATFRSVNCSGYDHYGLVSRAPNYYDGFGYYIAFSCNGQYYVQKWDDGGTSTVINWTPDSHILAGSGQTNRLGVWVDGSNFRLYANGVLIKEFSDSSLTAGGHYGIFGSALDSANFTFRVEEIAHWNLP